jgi:hypothetical protein
MAKGIKIIKKDRKKVLDIEGLFMILILSFAIS